MQCVCNACGKRIAMENEIAKEDYIKVRKDWGYFSKKDGRTQSFVLCERCADRIIGSFVIPAEMVETIELL